MKLCPLLYASKIYVSVWFAHLHCNRTMSLSSGETFASSMSRDVLEDWLAVLFQENKTQLESESSANAEVIRYSPAVTI